ncbi:MAG: PH domain-containing protein [Candidatus Cyclobacteriaceae bacterium M3_2C_046]
MSQIQKYPSKIGWPILLILALSLGSIALLMIQSKLWIGVLLIGLVLFFFVHLFQTTYYIILDDILQVKSSFLINKSIKIASIRLISETNNPLGAPANSLDRLEIHFNRFDSILVSPRGKHQFIHHLKTINPDIQIILKEPGKSSAKVPGV